MQIRSNKKQLTRTLSGGDERNDCFRRLFGRLSVIVDNQVGADKAVESPRVHFPDAFCFPVGQFSRAAVDKTFFQRRIKRDDDKLRLVPGDLPNGGISFFRHRIGKNDIIEPPFPKMSAGFAVKPPQTLFYQRPKVGKRRGFLIGQQIVDFNKNRIVQFFGQNFGSRGFTGMYRAADIDDFPDFPLLFPKVRTALSF